MKAQVGYLSVVVALVLFFATVVSSHATQHRDPLLPQEVGQDHATDSTTIKARTNTKKAGVSSKTATKGKRRAAGSSSALARNGQSQSHSGSGTGMK